MMVLVVSAVFFGMAWLIAGALSAFVGEEMSPRRQATIALLAMPFGYVGLVRVLTLGWGQADAGAYDRSLWRYELLPIVGLCLLTGVVVGWLVAPGVKAANRAMPATGRAAARVQPARRATGRRMPAPTVRVSASCCSDCGARLSTETRYCWTCGTQW